MRLYKTTYEDDGVSKFSWSGTQADARAKKKDFENRAFDDVRTEEVDVPTSKPELLAWLNANVKGE